MAKELDEIFYDALRSSQAIMRLTDGRIFSTCIEVPPAEDDNTPIPYIIITDDGYTNDLGTKDWMWEGPMDHCKASVIISAGDRSEVATLRRLVRQAIENYVFVQARKGEAIPMLTNTNSDGTNWDWTKPCYYDTIHYQCDMDVQEEPEES